MKRSLLAVTCIMIATAVAWGDEMGMIKLPAPKTKGAVSVEEAIQKRRSVRGYSEKDLSVEQLSQLLWACQGVTEPSRGLRAAPSAGALYPLEIYVVKQDGVYHYLPAGHALEKVNASDVRQQLASSAYGQSYVAQAPADIVVAAVYERVTGKYGERGVRYTDMEAGHAAENVFLQAVALGLDSVAVGAFSDASVANILGLPKGVKPLYILPVGYRR